MYLARHIHVSGAPNFISASAHQRSVKGFYGHPVYILQKIWKILEKPNCTLARHCFSAMTQPNPKNGINAAAKLSEENVRHGQKSPYILLRINL